MNLMYPLNQNKGYQSSLVDDLPLQSHDAYDIQQKVKGSIIDKFSNFDNQWQLQKAFSINNKRFHNEFTEKKIEFQNKSPLNAYREIRYGFLATIKENMIHKVAEEGLEVRLCPYNYFGHSISGVHISQNADVCMKEASSKVGPEDEIILITFKYMLGKHKVVPMYHPDVLLAPTPNYDSHLCEERPDPAEKIGNQYIKSLVYLYEFENHNFDPTIRPRHCCPVSALVFKPSRLKDVVDLTESEPVISNVSVYNDNPISFLKPVPQSHWGREFLLEPTPSAVPSSILIHKNDRNDSRKVVMSVYNNPESQAPPRSLEPRIEKWNPIRHDIDNRCYMENFSGDNYDRIERPSRNRSLREMEEMNYPNPVYPERDRSFESLKPRRDVNGQDKQPLCGFEVQSSSSNYNGRNTLPGNRVSTLRDWFK